MSDNPQAFPCSRCGAPSTIYQGHQHLCSKHYRFGQMKAGSKRHGKSVPTHEQLEGLCVFGMPCGDYSRPMNWLAIDGQSTVVTLQHYRDGTYGLVCRSCNTRHAHMPEDSFRLMPKDNKFCPQCETSKLLSEFVTDSGRGGEMKKKSWCKSCSSKSHANWRAKQKLKNTK